MKLLFSLALVLVGVYVLLAVVLYLFQNSMVFLGHVPGRELQASPGDIGLQYEDVSIDTSDGERLHGWFVPAASGGGENGSRGVLLFFHGNAGNISHRLDSIAIFHRLGLDVLIVDYRGYGRSSGRTTEMGTYRDAQAAWDYLVIDRGVAAGRIVIFGRSLGGAVAAWLASELTPAQTPAALIIESGFTSVVDMARELYPVFPARLLARLEYPVSEYVARLQCPVLIVHSRDDEIIPFAMGRTLFDAVPGRKSFLELRGDHNAGFWISRETYVAGLETFLDEVAGD